MLTCRHPPQMLTVLAGITQPLVELELKNPNKQIKGISLASTIGLLIGALFWGFTADIVGRSSHPQSRATQEDFIHTSPLFISMATDRSLR